MTQMLVRRFSWPRAETEDAGQVALLALVSALDRFDPDRGRFSPFAVPSIIGALKRYRRDRGWGVRPPRPVLELYLECQQASEELTGVLKRAPRSDEIARRVGTAVAAVDEALGAAHLRVLPSLDGPDIVADAGGNDPAPLVMLRWALQRLPEADRKLLELRFSHDLTQAEIGRLLGCSQMQVSRMLRHAQGRLARLL